MSEQSIASARASVMIYDEVNKKWIPSGSSSGLSKVHIYQHTVNNTFRVVGRKLHDQEVVINCSILKGLKYNQATATFHQWRDSRQVYGLNFSSKDDAEAFAFAMMHSVETLNNISGNPPRIIQNGIAAHNGIQPPPQQQQQQQIPPLIQQQQQPISHTHSNNNYHPPIETEDMGYRSMTREDIQIITERRMSQPQQQIIPNLSSPNTPVVNNSIPPGHHRNNSANTNIPPPPPPANFSNQHMNGTGGGPPPPPPPMPVGPAITNGEVGSLAAALANAQLRKANRPAPDAISTTSTSSSSSSGSTSSGSLYGTLRGNNRVPPPGQTNGTHENGTNGTSLMDEMARTLARRRAMVKENSAPSLQENNTNSLNNSHDEGDSIPNKKDGQISPKMNQRKRTGSDTSSGIIVNGTSSSYDCDMESLKQDILKEVRKELKIFKAEIIDAIKIELNRR